MLLSFFCNKFCDLFLTVYLRGNSLIVFALNENIDILLATAKMASRNNHWTHLAAHTISMSYNVSMIWHYQYQRGLANEMGPGYLTQEQIRRFRQERLKHTVFGLLDGVGLILSAIGAMQEKR